MEQHPLWQDEDWLLLLQLYLLKPVGVKPLYGRDTVALALELHIEPRLLYNAMFRLRHPDTPRLRRMVEQYSSNKSWLGKKCAQLRRMRGFGNADAFYDGVDLKESWEKDFLPIEENEDLTPLHLILILDTYFRLTPVTMDSETPEVADLARLMGVKPQRVAEVMDVFMFCDPYLNRDNFMIDPLLPACQKVWDRYGEGDPVQLAALAAQLKEYFQ